MNREFEILARRVENAASPLDVFGEIETRDGAGLSTLKRKYRAYARIAHPDRYPVIEEKALAHTLFRSLTQWMSRAQAEMKSGRYGRTGAPEGGE